MAQLVQAEDLTKEEAFELAEKCVDFTELLCARAFYPYQRHAAKAICVDVLANLGNTLTGLFARQSGKSETVANTASALMVIMPKLANMKDPENPRRYMFPQLSKYKLGFWVGIFSPSSTQSSTTFKRLKDRLNSIEGRQILESREFALEGYDSLLPFTRNARDYLEMNNGSFCLMMSADKQANIESKTFHLILLDESQDLDGFVVDKSIMPMGAATNATSIATGTPGTTKGFFFKQIEEGKRDEKDRRRYDKHLQPQLHFQYDYKEVQKHNPNYRKYILKEKKRLGEDSDEFKMAYRLIWMLERGMAISQELFDDLTIKKWNITTSGTDFEAVAGLDWGKSQDSTVLTVGRPRYDEVDEQGKVPVDVIYWWERLGDDYESLFAELSHQVGNFNIRTLSCDATGVGEPLYDRLQANLLNTTVIPVRFTSQSKDHLYKHFLLMLQEKKCMWPGDSRLRQRKYWKMFQDQMLNLQKEYKNGYLACHAPEDQRNAHDDFPDSLALMLWCIHEEAMPMVQTSAADWYAGHNWHRDARGPGFSLRA